MKENNFVLKSASDVSSFIINLATKTIKSKEANVVVKLRKQKVSLKLKPSKELFRQNLLDYFHCKQSDIIVIAARSAAARRGPFGLLISGR